MSRNMYITKKQSSNVRKPFCKVCQDAGKPETVYSTHWVKDTNGKVICPTLLATECRYCFAIGHTTKFCPVLEKIKKDKNRITSSYTQPVKQDKKIEKKVTGYSVLQVDDSDTEDEDTVFPQLCKNESSNYIAPYKFKWSDIAALEPAEEEAVINTETGDGSFVSLHNQQSITPEKQPVYKLHTPLAPKKIVNWADCSDSDSEDDETYFSRIQQSSTNTYNDDVYVANIYNETTYDSDDSDYNNYSTTKYNTTYNATKYTYNNKNINDDRWSSF